MADRGSLTPTVTLDLTASTGAAVATSSVERDGTREVLALLRTLVPTTPMATPTLPSTDGLGALSSSTTLSKTSAPTTPLHRPPTRAP
jgi:hypothetical protein